MFYQGSIDPFSFLLPFAVLMVFDAEVFVFGDVKIHHNAGQSILVELKDKANSAIIFQSQMTILK